MKMHSFDRVSFLCVYEISTRVYENLMICAILEKFDDFTGDQRELYATKGPWFPGMGSPVLLFFSCSLNQQRKVDSDFIKVINQINCYNVMYLILFVTFALFGIF